MTENTATPAELLRDYCAAKADPERMEWQVQESFAPRLAADLEAVLAERDALAAIRAEALAWADRALDSEEGGWAALDRILALPPADALAARDARVRLAALRDAAADLQGDGYFCPALDARIDREGQR